MLKWHIKFGGHWFGTIQHFCIEKLASHCSWLIKICHLIQFNVVAVVNFLTVAVCIQCYIELGALWSILSQNFDLITCDCCLLWQDSLQWIILILYIYIYIYIYVYIYIHTSQLVYSNNTPFFGVGVMASHGVQYFAVFTLYNETIKKHISQAYAATWCT